MSATPRPHATSATNAAQLGEFELVVSNRLHTCILTLAADTPVLPIEPSILKMTGLFGTFEYPISVINPSDDPEWSRTAIHELDRMLETRARTWRANRS